MRLIKQFWTLLTYCNQGSGKVLNWALLAIIFTLEMLSIYLSIQLIKWTAGFYNALEQRNLDETLHQLAIFGMIVAGNVGIYLVEFYAKGWLEIRWRERLTNAALTAWLRNKAYWFLSLQSESEKPDNPDQRIAEDCAMFVTHTLTEGIELITRIIGLFSYVVVLWGLATFALEFNLFGFEVSIPRYMVWAPFAYVFLSSLLTHLFGRRLKETFVEQQKKEADFRFGMAHMRQHAAEIAIMGGEKSEREQLDQKFLAVCKNRFRLLRRQVQLGLFTRPYYSTILRIPMFLALPGYFAGAVNFGGLMQLGSASQQVATTLSWFIFSYRKLAELVSAISRLSNFIEKAKAASAENNISTEMSATTTLSLSDVTLHTPDEQQLLQIPELSIEAGTVVWLRGASGLGKTTLLRLIAGAWKSATGKIFRPDASSLFLSQKPYLPNSTLKAAVCYPASASNFTNSDMAEALTKTGLSKLLPTDIMKLHSTPMPNSLSGGELQRFALARALLNKPEWLFLDEATSALDCASEAQLLDMLRQELPETTLVMLSHREPGNLKPDAIINLEIFRSHQQVLTAPTVQPV
ncbi:putative ATP-binding cassette transporter [Paenochrobactrum gallinarii]|uniref:Putative ATP-binding cassette transporter n=1 Tax=Paenochrobactrum gallinarii TaxID=643673 RepID=A0A841LUM5_9HYPH|nr:ABC transporter ATP-binding protein/permease [Paenochrobactrum gallinarii]MBB6262035.1 putative ATP-binding cassette transporter [Paenochrobactrum gallinarii]